MRRSFMLSLCLAVPTACDSQSFDTNMDLPTPVGAAVAPIGAPIPGSSGGTSSNTTTAVPGATTTAPGTTAPQLHVSVLHADHRYVPGAMFGGWGPHLGHLVRHGLPGGASELWFADDACGQTGAQVCNVNVNRRIDYFRYDASGWTKVDSVALPGGVQQNTGSVLVGDSLESYGLDSGGGILWQCSRNMVTAAKRCSAVTSATGAGANYVGAGVSPSGGRIVWYTNVVDGGGGSFSFFANNGTAWNGPRAGALGGYNDVGYVNIAFGVDKDPNRFILHGQFVTGLAPSWSYAAGVAQGNIDKGNAVSWATPFVPPTGDSVMSTNDVLVDPDTGDTHLIARSTRGAALYYFRPQGGAWTRAASWDKTLRARLVMLADKTIAMARGPAGAGLTLQLAPAASRTAGAPIAWDKLDASVPSLPAGYADIQAIYPESTVYQDAPAASFELAVVGATHQNEVLHVSLTR